MAVVSLAVVSMAVVSLAKVSKCWSYSTRSHSAGAMVRVVLACNDDHVHARPCRQHAA